MIVPRQIAALLLTVSLVAPGIARAERSDEKRAAADVSRIDIDNFGRVSDHYYRGAEPDADDYAGLAALGIKALIDLRNVDADAEEKILAERVGMKYFRIPMSTHETPTAAKVQEFLRLVTDPSQGPVYVHCVGGRHRTGVMTAVYRMTLEGWTADQAFKEMKNYRFGPDFLHPEFKKFVYGYTPDPSLVAERH